MPFSLYSLSVLSLSGLLYGLFTKRAAFFFFFIYSSRHLITYCSKLRVVESLIHSVGIFCLMPGYTVTCSECFLYQVVFREGVKHRYSQTYLELVETLEKDMK